MKTAEDYKNRKTHTTFDVKYLDVPDTRPVKLKHKFLNWSFGKPKVSAFMFEVLRWMLKATKLPLGTKWNPLTKTENNIFYHLPVAVDVKTENGPLPVDIAKSLIRRAKYRIIMDKCLCRNAVGCKKYNHEIGCIVLGDTAIDFLPNFSHLISAEEACKHVDRGVAEGLVLTTARSRVDNYFFLFPDKHTIMGICFCCECCCFINKYNEIPKDYVDKVFPRIPGSEITVNEKCNGCGECVKTCPMNAITMLNGRALHGPSCFGCGRCVQNCPQHAVEMIIHDPLYARKVEDQLLSVANLDHTGGN